MKLTIYLDKATADYYMGIANAMGVPVRTAIRSTLVDHAIADGEASKGLIEEALTSMMKTLRGLEK